MTPQSMEAAPAPGGEAVGYRKPRLLCPWNPTGIDTSPATTSHSEPRRQASCTRPSPLSSRRRPRIPPARAPRGQLCGFQGMSLHQAGPRLSTTRSLSPRRSGAWPNPRVYAHSQKPSPFFAMDRTYGVRPPGLAEHPYLGLREVRVRYLRVLLVGQRGPSSPRGSFAHAAAAPSL